jgi:transposase-like protein
LALVALSVVEQRLDTVRAVLAGASVTEVAASVGVSRVSVHSWVRRYLVEGLRGLCGQKVALGRAHRHQTVTIWVSETTLAIELDGQDTRVVRRTTDKPVRNIKADRPRTVPSVS